VDSACGNDGFDGVAMMAKNKQFCVGELSVRVWGFERESVAAQRNVDATAPQR
jgi:hypothetical protein